MARRTVTNPRFNAIVFGLAGGLGGAIVMGLIAYLTPAPNTGGDPFFIVAASAMGFGTAAWAVGWLLHVLTGMAIGAVFGVAATRTSAMRRRRIGDKALIGVVVGIAAWVVLFVPMILLLTPESLSAQSLANGFVYNVTFGIILSVIFAFGQSIMLIDREVEVFKCRVCGATLQTQEELDKHMSGHVESEEYLRSSNPAPTATNG